MSRQLRFNLGLKYWDNYYYSIQKYVLTKYLQKKTTFKIKINSCGDSNLRRPAGGK